MAKSKATSGNGKPTNKSKAIREALTRNPQAGCKEIVGVLATKGLKVAPGLVYFVMSRQKLALRKAKRERAAKASQNSTAVNPVDLVLRVKDLARDVGGFRSLKQLVDMLAE